jgi:hypothetical protein
MFYVDILQAFTNAVPRLRPSVAGLSPRRPVFDPRSVHVRFVVHEVALGQISLPVLQFSPVSIIPPMLHTHSFTYHPRYIMFLSQYFSFLLSVPFHQCSILVFIYHRHYTCINVTTDSVV